MITARKMDDLDVSVTEVLRRAAEMYEADPKGGLQGQPFIFTVGEQGVVAHPVMVNVEPIALQVASTYGVKAIEQLALEGVRQRATGIPIQVLAGVGYLFPASGDFPQNAKDAETATFLRGQKAATTPWEAEGVVMVLDGPDGRRTYAALREKGEVADPLGEPRRMLVFATHVPILYPYPPDALTPCGGFS
jgi:hypothetical protein